MLNKMGENNLNFEMNLPIDEDGRVKLSPWDKFIENTNNRSDYSLLSKFDVSQFKFDLSRYFE